MPLYMKATEQYFPVVLFIMLHKLVIITCESVEDILKFDHSKVFLTFESVEEIRKYDHSNKSYLVERSCGAVYYAVQGGCNF